MTTIRRWGVWYDNPAHPKNTPAPKCLTEAWKRIPTRRHARYFDERADFAPVWLDKECRTAETLSGDSQTGHKGVRWTEYFSCRKTGDIYRVECLDCETYSDGPYYWRAKERHHRFLLDTGIGDKTLLPLIMGVPVVIRQWHFRPLTDLCQQNNVSAAANLLAQLRVCDPDRGGIDWSSHYGDYPELRWLEKNQRRYNRIIWLILSQNPKIMEGIRREFDADLKIEEECGGGRLVFAERGRDLVANFLQPESATWI